MSRTRLSLVIIFFALAVCAVVLATVQDQEQWVRPASPAPPVEVAIQHGQAMPTTCPPEVGNVEVTVIDNSGKPVAGARVELYRQPSVSPRSMAGMLRAVLARAPLSYGMTDAEGHCRLRAAEGVLTCIATHGSAVRGLCRLVVPRAGGSVAAVLPLLGIHGLDVTIADVVPNAGSCLVAIPVGESVTWTAEIAHILRVAEVERDGRCRIAALEAGDWDIWLTSQEEAQVPKLLARVRVPSVTAIQTPHPRVATLDSMIVDSRTQEGIAAVLSGTISSGSVSWEVRAKCHNGRMSIRNVSIGDQGALQIQAPNYISTFLDIQLDGNMYGRSANGQIALDALPDGQSTVGDFPVAPTIDRTTTATCAFEDSSNQPLLIECVVAESDGQLLFRRAAQDNSTTQILTDLMGTTRLVGLAMRGEGPNDSWWLPKYAVLRPSIDLPVSHIRLHRGTEVQLQLPSTYEHIGAVNSLVELGLGLEGTHPFRVWEWRNAHRYIVRNGRVAECQLPEDAGTLTGRMHTGGHLPVAVRIDWPQEHEPPQAPIVVTVQDNVDTAVMVIDSNSREAVPQCWLAEAADSSGGTAKPIHTIVGVTDDNGRSLVTQCMPVPITADAEGYYPSDPVMLGGRGAMEIIRLTRRQEVRGVVVTSDGEPVAGAIVSVSEIPTRDKGRSAESGGIESQSTHDGTFVVKRITPGPMLLRIRSGSTTTPEIVERTFRCSPADTDGRRFIVWRGLTLTGNIVEASGVPIVGSKVSAIADCGSAAGVLGMHVTTHTDASGNFEFRGLPSGQYTLVASDMLVPSATCVRKVVAQCDLQSSMKVVMVMSAERTISGRVVESGGEPVRGRWLCARRTRTSNLNVSATMELPNALTDEDGRFCFSSLAEGEYTIGLLEQGPNKPAARLANGDRVPVGKEDCLLVLDIECRIEGKVITEDSRQPIVGALVWVETKPEGAVVGPCRSDSQGRFALYGLQDNAPVIVRCEESSARPLTLPSIWPGVRDIELVMPRGAIIRGRVTDAEGVGVEGATVLVLDINPNRRVIARAFEDGEFKASGLSGGPVRIFASLGAPRLTEVSSSGALDPMRIVPQGQHIVVVME